MTLSDEALMRAVRDGDLARLGVLFERYHLILFDFLSRMTGNRHTAEDLVQEVFVRILKYRATFQDHARFDSWLYRIARNARIDLLAHRDKAIPLFTEALETPDRGPAPDTQIQAQRESVLLRTALLRLRDEDRELIVLARYREMKHEDIAEILGITRGTVKVRLHRALNELRDTFMQLLERPSCNAKMP
jgi:RNA polymerase sigma factor (sigma-70 family)